MKKELFQPYKTMILKCMDSCVNNEQLQVCHDMMQRFSEQFKQSVPPGELNEAMDELSAAYLQEQAAQMIS